MNSVTFLLNSIKLNCILGCKTPRKVTYINFFGELNKRFIYLIIQLMKIFAQYLFYTANTNVNPI